MLKERTVTLAFALAAYVFFQFSYTSPATQLAYQSRRAEVRCCGAPSPRIFGIVWPILYAFITVSLVLFFDATQVQLQHNDIYIATFVVAVVNLLLNKSWPIYYNSVFTQPRANLVGLVVFTFLVFATAAALFVLEAIVVEHIQLGWLCLLLMGFYVLWTLYATFLMAQFACSPWSAGSEDSEDADILMENEDKEN
jgi:tryptophan-rich sensory protein